MGGRPSPAMTQKARGTSRWVNLYGGWYEMFRREPFPRVVRHDTAVLQPEKTQPNTGPSVCPIVSR